MNPSPYKKAGNSKFHNKRKYDFSSSVWTDYETCLLVITMNTIASSMVPLSVSNVTALYNHVVKSNISEDRELPLRAKRSSKTEGKLKQLEENQKVVLAVAAKEGITRSEGDKVMGGCALKQLTQFPTLF